MRTRHHGHHRRRWWCSAALWSTVLLFSGYAPRVMLSETPLPSSPITRPTREHTMTAQPSVAPTWTPISAPSTPQPTLAMPTRTPAEQHVLDTVARPVIQALAAGDMGQLAALAHPDQGIRFSPYAWVGVQDHVVATADLPHAMDDPTIVEWGMYDGIGTPIRLTFGDYYRTFVYSHAFAETPFIIINGPMHTDNTIDNSRNVYPGAMVVEYYVPGTPEYKGMDLACLRLVFVEQAGAGC